MQADTAIRRSQPAEARIGSAAAPQGSDDRSPVAVRRTANGRSWAQLTGEKSFFDKTNRSLGSQVWPGATVCVGARRRLAVKLITDHVRFVTPLTGRLAVKLITDHIGFVTPLTGHRPRLYIPTELDFGACALDLRLLESSLSGLGTGGPIAAGCVDMGQLSGIEGEKAGVTIPLGSVTTIGRSLSADVRLDDLTVSREHSRITQTGSGDFII